MRRWHIFLLAWLILPHVTAFGEAITAGPSEMIDPSSKQSAELTWERLATNKKPSIMLQACSIFQKLRRIKALP
jgi:hypothetical protein